MIRKLLYSISVVEYPGGGVAQSNRLDWDSGKDDTKE